MALWETAAFVVQPADCVSATTTLARVKTEQTRKRGAGKWQGLSIAGIALAFTFFTAFPAAFAGVPYCAG